MANNLEELRSNILSISNTPPVRSDIKPRFNIIQSNPSGPPSVNLNITRLNPPSSSTENIIPENIIQKNGPTESNSNNTENLFPNIEIVDILTTDLPEGASWAFSPIFRQKKVTDPTAPLKYTTWQIMFDSNTQELYSKSGQVDGLKVTHNHPIVPKSGRSVQKQALLEARRRHLEKRDEGYRERHESKPDITLVMLANKYTSNKISRWPVSVETKLDGERIRAYLDPNSLEGVALMSRTNKPKPWLNDVRIEVKKLLRYLPDGTWLDGEIYSPELRFEEQRSAISSKSTKNPNNDKLQYFIFDVVTNDQLVVEERNNLLAVAYSLYINDYVDANMEIPRYLLIVPMLMAFNDQEIRHFHDIFVGLGYEGIIIRHFAGTCIDTPWEIQVIDPISGTEITSKWCTLGNRTSSSISQSLYRERRSNNLLKLKDFQDEEGIVVDIKQGTGVEAGTVIYVVQDPRGNVFSVRPRGSHETRREIYNNFIRENMEVSYKEISGPSKTFEFTYTKPNGQIIQIVSSNPLNKRKEFATIGSQYLGRLYTYRYQETTSDGVPRFPVGISFRTDI